MATQRDAVTGAFGFTGRPLATRLLDAGREVVTLTRRSARPDPLRARLAVHPLAFDRPADLVEAMRGVDTLYDTYWLRFQHGASTYDAAVADQSTLVEAARRAGVRRIVLVSVIRAAPDGPTPYVRAKAAVERLVRESGLEWAIVRPTLTFGSGDILLNNLAWALRRLPIYGIPGTGQYELQPVHVADVARICVEVAEGPSGVTVDAAGPERLAYRLLVDRIRHAVGSHALVVPMPKAAVLLAARVLGRIVGDVVLTRHELVELTSSYLTSDAPALGRLSLDGWIASEGPRLGRAWSSELARNYRAG